MRFSLTKFTANALKIEITKGLLRNQTLPEAKSVIYQRIGAASGIVAPIVAFVCILSAIASYPVFSWSNNALSDLGVVPGLTASLFNFGLLACGVLAFNFAIFGLFTYFGKNWMGKIGSVVFAATTLALIAISVFNENFSPTHYLVSVAFFTLAPIALFILTFGFWLCRQPRLAAFTVSVGVAAALPWLLLFAFNYVPNVAIPEFLSGLAVSVWAIVLGKKMLSSKV
jgi:hypothetical membrane protein